MSARNTDESTSTQIGRSTQEWIGATPDAAIPPRVRLRVFEAHGGLCALSGRRITPADKWQVDHIRPLSMGGEHRESNLQPVLADRHREKTAADVADKAKAMARAKKHVGITRSGPAMPGSRRSKWKRKMDGTVVRRDQDEL